MATSYIGQKTGSSYIVNVAAPIDVRTVVDSVEDLTNKSISYMYTGLIVNVKGTGDLYILTTHPRLATNINSWVKISGDGVDPADYLSYYQEQLGAKILDSADGLVGIANPFTGQLAYVKDDPNTSEDEPGLYIYTGQGWKKIFTGNSASGSGDISSVITTDGTIPESGTGFSITANDPDALVEEIYVDDYLHAGVYYTSKGINSSKDNGGSELEGIDYITLSKGNSWIRFDNRSTITLSILDDSLGFNMENIVGIIDSNGTETRNPYAGYPKTESPISLSLNGNTYIKFNKDIYFTGLTEVRGEDSTEYIFGQTGSHYEDLDIYSVDVLPTVYAYADGKPVRVLTEGDKDELINMISEATDFTPITDTQIRNLF